MIPIVVDTDPGIDDAVTLALAALSPTIDLVAVTTTYGSASLAATTRNAREVLRLCNRSDVSVVPGCNRPLKRDLATAPHTHGPTGVGHAPVPETTPEHDTADKHALLDVLSGSQQLELITIGPLTNLASAIQADESLVRSRVRRHIGMFGTVRTHASTERRADFNAWCDPEATDLVLRSGLNTTMVSLDAARQMVLTPRDVEILVATSDPLVKWLGRALEFYLQAYEATGHVSGCFIHDVLTVGELLCPGLLTCDRLRLRVNLGDGVLRGHTTVDAAGHLANVAIRLDVPSMQRLLGVVFGRPWLEWLNRGGPG
jgi:inosine-uridine nucleoside N-ribohydrolase